MPLAENVSALATRIAAEFKAHRPRLLPSGGAVGQVLTKTAGTDYAASWAAPAVGGSGGTVGAAVLDFGTGRSVASVAVTGQAGMLASALPRAWVQVSASPDHSADEHVVEELEVVAGSVVAGVGFTVYGRTRNVVLRGRWNVGWAY